MRRRGKSCSLARARSLACGSPRSLALAPRRLARRPRARLRVSLARRGLGAPARRRPRRPPRIGDRRRRPRRQARPRLHGHRPGRDVRSPRGPEGQARRRLLLPEGRDPGLHQGGVLLPRRLAGHREDGRRAHRHLGRHDRLAQGVRAHYKLPFLLVSDPDGTIGARLRRPLRGPPPAADVRHRAPTATS